MTGIDYIIDKCRDCVNMIGIDYIIAGLSASNVGIEYIIPGLSINKSKYRILSIPGI